ncbi:hypothetical protein A3H16_03830 [Candidatus Kaiserbacteria bacterium RIFCSPLOWO2_12_FULL_53_8]|uniref:Archease domain-containing protein n=1 Tax=Candidatus Kaiserbacteria bacterium RIFCSPLOWO2_12_FULL_53_8 TaxID=1798529 RepID=A0A1F6FYV9_9BACT|nr:MAG: hypothetical protein A3H16_03830 [Candidatus Kaiserbacteria bacterium RIFCSPLOWO2_12_FULL_53_8]
MAYSFHEHTADVRMDVEGDSYGALLEQSLLGMFEYLRPAGKGKRVERAIEVESPDRAALVVDFLNEALSLAHAHKEEYDSATFKVLSDRHVRATLVGNRVGSFGEDIKAVTYHEAAVERDAEDVWRAHFVFDI